MAAACTDVVVWELDTPTNADVAAACADVVVRELDTSANADVAAAGADVAVRELDTPASADVAVRRWTPLLALMWQLQPLMWHSGEHCTV